MMNQELLDRVLSSPRLPSLTTVALDVIDLVQQPDVHIKEIARTIQNDPALAGKILKTVNSSFYGQAYAVSTITHALVVLGFNSVKTLALGFSLVGESQVGVSPLTTGPHVEGGHRPQTSEPARPAARQATAAGGGGSGLRIRLGG